MADRRPGLSVVLNKLDRYARSANIADELDDELLDEIGQAVRREYEIDKESREEWEKTADKAMDAALQVREPKNYPFKDASNVKYPQITIAALQFGARAYPSIVDGPKVVKGLVVGDDPDGSKRDKADRIGEHMSYQLLNEMEEWEEDTDTLLHHLPIIGCAFRKVWRSAELGRNVAQMVPAKHLVVNNSARSMDEAPRVTQELFLYPQEVQERVLAETFLDEELGLPAESDGDTDAPHMFLEQHRLWDLDGDGYREPYIVTVHKDTSKAVRIVANFDFDDIVFNDKRVIRIPKAQYFVKYTFIPDPKGGFYGIGFGSLLESISETINTTINQMMDAGNLQNAGGGLIGRGINLKKGIIRREPGKYTYVESSGGNIRDAIYNFEDPEPSATLYQLLVLMLDAAKDITAVKDVLTGDTGGQQQTATTTLAMIEQGLKVFTAIYKRIHRSLMKEYKLLYKLNAEHLEDQQYFRVLDDQRAVARSDYDPESVDVCPVSDPSLVTDMQRAKKAEFLLGLIEAGLVKPVETTRRAFELLSIEDDDLIMEAQEGPSPGEEAALAEAESKAMRNMAAAEKDTAQAEKSRAETEQIDADRDAAQFGQSVKTRLAPFVDDAA